MKENERLMAFLKKLKPKVLEYLTFLNVYTGFGK